ncbi:class I SAM-dependent methyltransferase [Treponema primitia]|uniref:methyltransferase domain-containing protein n=1 Tax=Treponema primitia TaxID=88058 RepID=UPI00397FE7FD
MTAGSLLVVPAIEKNRGGGHLVRGAALVRSLRRAGREAFLFLPEDHNRELLGIAGLNDVSWIRWEDPRKTPGPEEGWDFIILDKFRTSPEEAASWSALAPLVGIDEGGSYRRSFDFLIDILPNLYTRRVDLPNITAPSMIPLPVNRRPSFHKKGSPLRVLISFGAEDTAGLSFPAAMALVKSSREDDLEITLIATTQFPAKAFRAFSNVIFIPKGIPELREHLAEYDLLITHFGLCAFEAIHARLPVLLVSPGGYHEKLARHAGFFSAGTGPAAAGRIGQFLSDTNFLNSLAGRCENIASRYSLDTVPGQELGDLLAGFTRSRDYAGSAVTSCPACGAPGSRETQARFPGRTYRRCGRCGMIHMFRSSPPAIEYETDYFFGFYKKQYGKTYLEDFPNLIMAGKKRLSLIKHILGNRAGQGGAGRLLDIGCAYGPFLSAARGEGFSPQGIDPAADAVHYVREELGIPAQVGFFPDPSLQESEDDGSFGVITLWYVIEHFADLPPVLGEINRLLKKGGVLAFSTPSFSGISGKKSPETFLENSPQDHWTVWSPGICRKLLARYGFKLKKIQVTGHHPERFPLGNRFRKGGFIWNLLLYLSRLFGLGDTFECYAIKVRLP